jgi:hypothetical protein
MPSENIRGSALAWFGNRQPTADKEVFTSKFYSREESWSKTKVWFFQLPLEAIEPHSLIAQIVTSSN